MKKIISAAVGLSLILATGAQVAEAASGRGKGRVHPDRSRNAYATMDRSPRAVFRDTSADSSLEQRGNAMAAPAGR